MLIYGLLRTKYFIQQWMLHKWEEEHFLHRREWNILDPPG